MVNYPLGRGERRDASEDGGCGRRKRYLEVLLDQVQSKMVGQIEKQKVDDEKMASHFQQFDGYWGRPGYGAPIQGKGPQKENLMKILHYPTQKVNRRSLAHTFTETFLLLQKSNIFSTRCFTLTLSDM